MQSCFNIWQTALICKTCIHLICMLSNKSQTQKTASYDSIYIHVKKKLTIGEDATRMVSLGLRTGYKPTSIVFDNNICGIKRCIYSIIWIIYRLTALWCFSSLPIPSPPNSPLLYQCRGLHLWLHRDNLKY